jgi:hypothetical protein
VTLVDPDDVRANLLEADEIPAAIRWAEHHGLRHEWNGDELVFKLWLQGQCEEGPLSTEEAREKEDYLLVGTFPDYRVMPPEWRFVDPRDERDIGTAAYPHPGPFQNGSILHGNGVICAPWNRLAYADRGGPHGDWQDAASWQATATDRTRALTIPDMLGRIRAEVEVSPRRLAPLPPSPEEREAA